MKSTRETRDEALRQPTFRRLYLGALKIPNPRRRLIACYIILLAGRLGLRVSEIQHLRSAWIDWKRGEICIPDVLVFGFHHIDIWNVSHMRSTIGVSLNLWPECISSLHKRILRPSTLKSIRILLPSSLHRIPKAINDEG